MNRARSVLRYIAIVEQLDAGHRVSQAERTFMFRIAMRSTMTQATKAMREITETFEAMNRRERSRRFRRAVGV